MFEDKFYVSDHLYNLLKVLNKLDIEIDKKEKLKKYIHSLRSSAIKDIYHLIRSCKTNEEIIHILRDEISYKNDDNGTLTGKAMKEIRE